MVDSIPCITKVMSVLQVFGEIAEGLETLTRINEAYVDESNRPYKNIRLVPDIILIYVYLGLV